MYPSIRKQMVLFQYVYYGAALLTTARLEAANCCYISCRSKSLSTLSLVWNTANVGLIRNTIFDMARAPSGYTWGLIMSDIKVSTMKFQMTRFKHKQIIVILILWYTANAKGLNDLDNHAQPLPLGVEWDSVFMRALFRLHLLKHEKFCPVLERAGYEVISVTIFGKVDNIHTLTQSFQQSFLHVHLLTVWHHYLRSVLPLSPELKKACFLCYFKNIFSSFSEFRT